jgi:glycosyltransferase involved in cell wall biosynthesis
VTSALVSIVTPSYNQALYLEQAVQSVLDQVYKPVEYLVVDGSSSDGSVEIIRKYSDRLAWWVSEPDSGQAEAINKGFARATGKYIGWLNSDDIYLPGAITTIVAAFEANPALGMVFGDAITITASGETIKPLTFGEWGLLDLMGFRIICQPAVFIRKSVFDQAGPVDATYHYLLDHQLWIRMARLAPIKHITIPLASARHHAQAKNVAHAERFGEEAFRILAWMQEQPDLAVLLKSHRRRIEAGAYRLSARYLLDGGQPGPALKAYGHALWLSPAFALQHWRRMVYAAASLAGAKKLADRAAQSSAARRTTSPPGSYH